MTLLTAPCIVNFKMDAWDPILLSEGACHQLGIGSYHHYIGVQPLQDSVTAVPELRVELVEICMAVTSPKQDYTRAN